MKTLVALGAVGLILGFSSFSLFSFAAQAQTVRWSQIIGIIEGENLVGSGAGQVTGAPGPWSTSEGFARVNLENGNVVFLVRGLVLAAGNGIGTPGPVTQVTGTLVCDTDGSAGGGNSTLIDTPLVPLSSQGNAHFRGNFGNLPDACVSESDIAFLIRAFGNLWIGNGAVRRP
ncbi:MAG: hypothetical protein ACREOB_01310 [Thermodesulfobacteriota bacterium]